MKNPEIPTEELKMAEEATADESPIPGLLEREREPLASSFHTRVGVTNDIYACIG